MLVKVVVTQSLCSETAYIFVYSTLINTVEGLFSEALNCTRGGHLFVDISHFEQYKIFLQKVIVSTQKLTKVLTEYENEQCVQ